MKTFKFIYRVHALRRMFERAVASESVEAVVATGDVIESYGDDKPYPSFLYLGFADSRPLHVVAAYNQDDNEVVGINV